MKDTKHLDLMFVTAKGGAGDWGVALLKDGEAVGWWTPEEAIAEAASLERKAKICLSPGFLP